MNYRSFAIRSLIAVLFGPLIILSALAGSWYWLAFIAVVAVGSVYEFYKLAEKKGSFALILPGITIVLICIIAFYFFDEKVYFPILLSGAIILFFIELYRKQASPLLNLSATLFAPAFYGAGLGSFILIRELPARYGLAYAPAGGWIVMLILSIWVCDTAAYIVGSYLGKHKLIPRISPNKSIEGTVAGFFFALITAYICYITFIQGLRLQDALVIGGIAGSIGQYGDLFESMFKRDAGVKDSSHIIPEHGGILDRFDSLTLSAPVVFLYLSYCAF